MQFTFESLNNAEPAQGSSYMMDFGEANSTKQAALVEARLLTVFGEPVYTSQNMENSFEYVIKAMSDTGRSVILTVYNVGIVHIGCELQDSFARDAADALIAYVNAATPTDYERTVYYLDFAAQIDICVKNGQVTLENSEISEEKCEALFKEWFGKGTF